MCAGVAPTLFRARSDRDRSPAGPGRHFVCYRGGRFERRGSMDAIKLIAVILIIAGILALVFGGFSFTKEKHRGAHWFAQPFGQRKGARQHSRSGPVSRGSWSAPDSCSCAPHTLRRPSLAGLANVRRHSRSLPDQGSALRPSGGHRGPGPRRRFFCGLDGRSGSEAFIPRRTRPKGVGDDGSLSTPAARSTPRSCFRGGRSRRASSWPAAGSEASSSPVRRSAPWRRSVSSSSGIRSTATTREGRGASSSHFLMPAGERRPASEPASASALIQGARCRREYLCAPAGAGRSSAPGRASISSHCAIQPEVRGIAKSTVNVAVGSPDRLVDEPGVEVDVGIELALDEVLVLEGDALELRARCRGAGCGR